jgi:RimJ/RimL family protein N-acetyltransferase
VLAFNVTVIRLHNKFGFVEEGIFRDHHKGPKGFEDVHRLGLLQTEWMARRDGMLALLSGERRPG